MTEVLGDPDDDSVGREIPGVRYLHRPSRLSGSYQFNALLSRLVGYHLQTVQFVGGYVQLGFDSPDSADLPVLTCEVMPVVETPAGPIGDRQPGYADALRSLIGEHVVGTDEAPHQGLRVAFALSAVVLRPTPSELRGPAIAMLSDFADGSSVSWRPGGAGFEYLG
ncbi:hypothetical protein ACNUDN_20705 [Mycobacterium sp. smrl_JER01]|uniref:hypothetical protein n=1 Tax=Mycobacterium sp. smrl_JER01 TaxID=3402633 RepID=UPI003ABE49BB